MDKLFDTALLNMTPGIRLYLADKLGVSMEAIERLGVGYMPDDDAWLFPERDANGKIIGLLKRFPDGKKITVKGSKRGLIYALAEQSKGGGYVPGAHNWQRVARDVPCPICGKPDWCLVSAENPADPAACICARRSMGAEALLGDAGWLHIRKPEGEKHSRLRPALVAGEYVLIVEGASDTLAAMTLGFSAIGRPQARGGIPDLKELTHGLHVVVIGDNDSGAGQAGMEETAVNLNAVCKEVRVLLPPDGIKDLRAWVQAGLTKDALLDEIQATRRVGLPADVLISDDPFEIANQWIGTCFTTDSTPSLRQFDGAWYDFDGNVYVHRDEAEIRSELYRFLSGKKFQKVKADRSVALEPYRVSRSKVNDIMDAACVWTSVPGSPPLWLSPVKDRPTVDNLMAFRNGVLDVDHYLRTGSYLLYEPDPRLFTTCCFPYDFDETAVSPLWEETVKSILGDDPEKIRLLHQWMGYLCTADTSAEKFMIFRGGTRTGKGTLLTGIEQMLGKTQCAATSFESLANSFGLENLVGKLAAFMGDAKSPSKYHAEVALERLLQIVGRDDVTLNRKYQRETTHSLGCRFTMAVNLLPRLRDQARAIQARALLLEFTNSFEGREDFTLKDRICREAAAGKLINYALGGLRDLRNAGMVFTMPDSSRESLADFRAVTSPASEFLDECCTLGEELTATVDELYEAWQWWCKSSGVDPMYYTKQQFSSFIVTVHPGLSRGKRSTIEGRKFQRINGLNLQHWIKAQIIND